MSLVVYLAHPVAPTEEQLERARKLLGHQSRTAPDYWDFDETDVQELAVDWNLDGARSWLHWLVMHTNWAVSAPWMPYVQTLNDATSSHRERGLRDDCLMASRCDAIVLCGGRISNGMAMERDAVQKAGKAIVSLIDLGPTPPANTETIGNRNETHSGFLMRRLREALGG